MYEISMLMSYVMRDEQVQVKCYMTLFHFSVFYLFCVHNEYYL